MSVRELSDKIRKRDRRRTHVRKTIVGTAEKPRMTVFRSNLHLYVQVIDDTLGRQCKPVVCLAKKSANGSWKKALPR